MSPSTIAELNVNNTALEAAQILKNEIKGKNVLIVGPSVETVGFETAKALASQGAGIITLASRSMTRLWEAKEAILKETPTAQIRLLVMDMSDLDSCRAAAKEVLTWPEPLHVVIQSGSAPPSEEKESWKKGLEYRFYTNHLGPFVFINTLVPKVKEAGPGARIVILVSRAHRLGWDRLMEELYTKDIEEYDIWRAYGRSKCCNVVYAADLGRRLKGSDVEVFVANCGPVLRYTMDNMKKWGWIGADGKPDPKLANIDFIDVAQGAKTPVICAFDPSLKGHTGEFIQEIVPDADKLKGEATRVPDMVKFWKLSEELVEEKFDI